MRKPPRLEGWSARTQPVRFSSVIPRAVLALALFAGLAVGEAAAEDQAVKRLPRVVILATGGTIAGAGNKVTQTVGYTAAVTPVDDLIASVPVLKEVADVRGEQVAQIASENMTPEIWLKLARRVNEILAGSAVDGLVVTHGTDTLEETAYFLDLTVKSDKPVIVVGAMRPPTALSADGPLNLFNAVALAASPEARGHGVMVLMNDEVHDARNVAKTGTTSTAAFQSPGSGPLGVMVRGKPCFYRTPTRRHTRASEFAGVELPELPRVDIVYAYAGVGRELVDAAVAAGAKGVVHAGTGDGSLADRVKVALVAARAKQVAVVRASRTGSGLTVRNGEANDDALGFVAADSLNPQKARILLMLALTKTSDPLQIQRYFNEY